MTLFVNDGRTRTVMHVSFLLLSWLSMLTIPSLPYGIPLLWCACCYWAQHGTDHSLLVSSTIVGFVFDAVQGLTFGTWALMLAATFFVGAGAQSCSWADHFGYAGWQHCPCFWLVVCWVGCLPCSGNRAMFLQAPWPSRSSQHLRYIQASRC